MCACAWYLSRIGKYIAKEMIIPRLNLTQVLCFLRAPPCASAALPPLPPNSMLRDNFFPGHFQHGAPEHHNIDFGGDRGVGENLG